MTLNIRNKIKLVSNYFFLFYLFLTKYPAIIVKSVIYHQKDKNKGFENPLPMNVKYILPLLAIVSLMLLAQCNDEVVTRDYPRVTATNISNISDSGAVFRAEITDMGNAPITEHGFVWSTEKTQYLSSGERIFLGPCNSSSDFEAEIKTTLKENSTYYVCAFVVSGEYTVYGKTESFVSLGSKAPRIKGFSPESAGWGDTITIYGENFSYVTYHNQVLFNDVAADYTILATDTIVKALLPPLFTDPKGAVSVSICGNVTTFKSDSVIFLEPEFYDYTPKSARWSDTLYLIGRYLKYFGASTSNGVFLDNTKLYVRDYDTAQYIIVSDDITAETSKFSIKLNGYSFTSPDNFTLLPPVIDSISPDEATWGATLYIYGRFNKNLSKNTIYFNSIKATISYCDSKIIKVTVPSTLVDSTSVISLLSGPFTVESPEKFHLAKPKVKYVTPSSGYSGTKVKIGGNFFRSGSTTVKIGSVNAVITSMNDSVIYCYVPVLDNNSHDIAVKVGVATSNSDVSFDVKNPVINSFSPTSVTFNDVITVTGDNFVSAMSWYLGTSLVSATYVNSNTVKLTVPPNMSYSAENITGTYTLNGYKSTTSSSESLELKDFIVTSISPMIGKGGDVLNLTGENLNTLYVSVMFGDTEATVSNFTATGMSVVVPALYNGIYDISVEIGGRTKVYGSKFIVDGPWSKLADLPFVSKYGWIMDFGDEVLYMTRSSSETSESLYSFNSSTLNFEKQVGTYNSGLKLAYSCILGDKAYIVGQKTTGGMALMMFDSSDRSLSYISDYPGNSSYLPLIMADDSVVYVGGGDYIPAPYTNSYLKLWKYSPATQKWTSLTDLPVRSHASNRVSLDGKVYCLGTNNAVYEYNPTENSWSEKSEGIWWGGDAGGKSNFIIDGNWYVGFGSYNGIVSSSMTNFFARWDPVQNIWEEIKNVPVSARIRPVSFSVGDKGFVGGCQYYGLTDFWMYDPSKE